ncbi:hypothetical protein [Mycolicibacterium mucogenicum]|jgi:hypothetical protein|nr:hypothetical protein [Mycolicibacterium mucogenicum]
MIRAVAVSGGQDCDADDLAESFIALPQTGTYIMGAGVAPAARIDLLVQALGIVEGVIARLDADDSHQLVRAAEGWSLLQLRERIRDFAEAAARG